MPHVITEKCIGEQYAACRLTCPSDAIHPVEYQDAPFMVIDPDACTDCGLCLYACPINSIVASTEEAPLFAQINKELTPLAKKYEAMIAAKLAAQKQQPQAADSKGAGSFLSFLFPSIIRSLFLAS